MYKLSFVTLSIVSLLTGCMGRNGLSTGLKKANLSVTENRWVREGIFLGLRRFYVYRVCTVLDLFVFNSIEFWSGENPITGAGALVDVPIEELNKMHMMNVAGAKIERLNSKQAKLYMNFDNGDRVSMDVTRTENSYTVSYLGKEFFQGHIQDEPVQKNNLDKI